MGRSRWAKTPQTQPLPPSLHGSISSHHERLILKSFPYPEDTDYSPLFTVSGILNSQR